MKAILLTGGNGTRLFPLTATVNKHLLPVYNKPLIFYMLSTLILAGFRKILIVCDPIYQGLFVNLLGDGSHFGINLEYTIQDKPRGIADAILVAESFIAKDKFCLALGDNIFFGEEFPKVLQNHWESNEHATVFLHSVENVSEFAVATLNHEGKLIKIEEKPQDPESDLAVTGIYLYDENAIKMAHKLRQSHRGELEISDINTQYLSQDQLSHGLVPPDSHWIDAGSHLSMLKASQMVHESEQTREMLVGCPFVAAWHRGNIDKDQLRKHIGNF